jgi:hypothetical protein
MKFEVVADEVVIGWSELEQGDPPMGVAFGRMHPTPAYSTMSSKGSLPQLRVRPEGAPSLVLSGGVHLEDHSADLGPDGIEVSILGLDATTYERYFPMHVKAYEAQFAK